MATFCLVFKIIWASPWTLVGAVFGGLALATGGRARMRSGILEFSGGAVRPLLRHAPWVRGAAALTLGHVILGQTPNDLDDAHEHELVHVRQYERWGILFLPAYFANSIWQMLHGRDPYWDNRFEREAYEIAP